MHADPYGMEFVCIAASGVETAQPMGGDLAQEDDMNKAMLQLAVAMLAGCASLMAAQQPAHPMQNQSAMACPVDMHGMMMGMMGDGMMRGQTGGQMGAMNDSSMMVQMRSELGLSDAQMQQMHTIHQRACAAAQPHVTLARQAHQGAMQALQGDRPNLDHFEDQLDKAAKHMVEAQVEMAKGMIEFRKTLTAAQRQKLDQMHQQMMQGSGMPRG